MGEKAGKVNIYFTDEYDFFILLYAFNYLDFVNKRPGAGHH